MTSPLAEATTFERRRERNGEVVLIARGKAYSHWLEVAIEEVTMWDAEGGEPAASEELLSGSIKWDGCANFGLEGVHLCGRKTAWVVSEAVAMLFDLGEELIQHWDGELAG